MMRRIAGKAGGGTDTTRDFEYTDWNEVRGIVARLGALLSERGSPREAVRGHG